MEGRILVYPAEQTEVDGSSPKFERRRRGAAPRQIRAQKSVAVDCDRVSPIKLRRSCPQSYYTPGEMVEPLLTPVQ